MASITKGKKAGGTSIWVVRWYPRVGANQKSKTYYSEDDALTFKLEVERALSNGEEPNPHRRRREMTVGELWPLYRDEQLPQRATNTRKNHRDVYRAYIAHDQGVAAKTLKELEADPALITEWRDRMLAITGPSAVRKAMDVLSAMLGFAVHHRRRTGLRENPMLRGRGVVKPSGKRAKPVDVFPPVVVEHVRAQLLESPGREERLRERDALFVSCMYLAGLRPEEVLGLTPELVGERSLRIEQVVTASELRLKTKTSEWRFPPLYPMLREEIDAYVKRWAVADDELIFSDPVSGGPLARHNYENWRKRDVWRPACERAAGRAHYPQLARAVPYSMRHSYASLRLRAGMWQNIAQLAADMGHSVTMLRNTYAHVLAEYAGTDPVDFEAEVGAARAAVGALYRPV